MMDYRFRQTSASPFVVVDLASCPPELTVDDAVLMIARENAQRVVFDWNAESGFSSRSADQLEEADRHVTSLFDALDVVQNYNGPGMFILCFEINQRLLGSAPLIMQFEAAIDTVLSRKVDGKTMLLVVWPKVHDELFAGRAYDRGEFVPMARPAAVDFDDFDAVIAADPPTNPDVEWAFGDNDDWIEFIDQLDEEGIAKLVSKGLHLHSVRRLRNCLDILEQRFVRRKHAIEMLAACAIARANMVYLGPPGTAKSLIVRSFAKTMGVRARNIPISEEENQVRLARNRQQEGGRRRLFEYLLTRYTTPEEIFGGTDINVLLSGGVHCRRTNGMLPQAEVAFLDEIFKANSAILNTLLSITNERLFYNMGRAFKLNMAFVVGASNETPDEAELGALYDRFPIRVPCERVPDDCVVEVIQRAHEIDSAEFLGSRRFDLPRVACLNDLRLLTKVVQGGVYGGASQAFGNPEFANSFNNLFLMIRREFGVSDRTPSQVLRLCRALALLQKDGPATQLSPVHLRPWGYVGPRFDSMADLQRVVKRYISEQDETAVDLYDAF